MDCIMIAFGFALLVYVVVMLIWTITMGMQYDTWRRPEDARWMLAGFIWPIVAAVLLVRFLGRAVVDSFRRS